MMDPKTITRFPAGVVALPPSKSLSHRALICAGLAAMGGGGESTLYNIGSSQDVDATAACMEQLGAVFEPAENGWTVRAGLPAKNPILDCGESGSTLRFLLPLSAVSGRIHRFYGHGRLMERPLSAYEEVFARSGVSFRRQGNEVEIQGPIQSGSYRLPGDVSSQFVSGLLLALPLLPGDSEIHLTTPLESAAYVAMTVDVMQKFGVEVSREGNRFLIPGGQRYKAADYTVEGDYSQAAFFLGAGALGCPVGCAGLPKESLQGDSAILDILRQMGVCLLWEDGVLWAKAAQLQAVTADVREIPDLVPPLATLCCFARGESHIVNAGRLRFKESDRLHALARELLAIGADIREEEDSLTIIGQETLAGGRADAWGDHRIAMALAVASIRCKSPVELTGWKHVNKSYPEFWADFEKEPADAAGLVDKEERHG